MTEANVGVQGIPLICWLWVTTVAEVMELWGFSEPTMCLCHLLVLEPLRRGYKRNSSRYQVPGTISQWKRVQQSQEHEWKSSMSGLEGGNVPSLRHHMTWKNSTSENGLLLNYNVYINSSHNLCCFLCAIYFLLWCGAITHLIMLGVRVVTNVLREDRTKQHFHFLRVNISGLTSISFHTDPMKKLGGRKKEKIDIDINKKK